MRVADILKGKGTAVMTVSPTDTIEHLAQRLRLAGVGAMVVSHDGHSMDGIISERDIAYAVAVYGRELVDLHVSDLMTRTVITCSPQDTIAHVARIMTVRRIRHLPVMEKNNLTGLLSIGDVLKHRVTEIELEENVLRDIALAGR
ncbi:MAG: CBS domain-containing protein [Rhodomicrobium sp.]